MVASLNATDKRLLVHVEELLYVSPYDSGLMLRNRTRRRRGPPGGQRAPNVNEIRNERNSCAQFLKLNLAHRRSTWEGSECADIMYTVGKNFRKSLSLSVHPKYRTTIPRWPSCETFLARPLPYDLFQSRVSLPIKWCRYCIIMST